MEPITRGHPDPIYEILPGKRFRYCVSLSGSVTKEWWAAFMAARGWEWPITPKHVSLGDCALIFECDETEVGAWKKALDLGIQAGNAAVARENEQTAQERARLEADRRDIEERLRVARAKAKDL